MEGGRSCVEMNLYITQHMTYYFDKGISIMLMVIPDRAGIVGLLFHMNPKSLPVADCASTFKQMTFDIALC